MKTFLDENFLLSNQTAIYLYHKHAAMMPIIDYHCHVNPKDIAEDIHFENITKLWIVNGTYGDHYKWRLMRANGVSEKYITGDKDDKEKFFKFAQTLEKAIGNPIYHWSHLELKRYFNYEGTLNSESAQEVWDLCNQKLQEAQMSVRSIIKNSHVNIICTTDDPIDNLMYHQQIKADDSFATQVLPAWRPDKAMNIEAKSFKSYLGELSEVTNININSFKSLKEALCLRMDYFADNGCCVSDHALEFIMAENYNEDEIENILTKALQNEPLSKIEELKYKSCFMEFVAQQYQKRNWVMQLHYGCQRNNNQAMFNLIGADTGFDCINNYAPTKQMATFFNNLNNKNALPKTIIYSLNPNDDTTITSLMGCFQGNEEGIVNKIQHGSAWWFNDHKSGMIAQITDLANEGLLGNFNGMLTDSRSFISYTRHEYFRRILCDVIGSWVENGEFPNDQRILSALIKDISYNNAINYFNFNLLKK